MTAIQPINVPMPVKLTIEQFELLDRNGAFRDYAKAELIEGAIYTMQGQYRPHGYAKDELYFRLRMALREIGSALHPITEVTVGMPPVSAPEPDISLTLEPRGEGYVPLNTVALAIEVADSTAAFDLGEKAPSTRSMIFPNIGWSKFRPPRFISSGPRPRPAIASGGRSHSARRPQA